MIIHWLIDRADSDRVLCDPYEAALLRLQGKRIQAEHHGVCACGSLLFLGARQYPFHARPFCNGNSGPCGAAYSGNIGAVVQTACMLLSEPDR